MLPTEVRIFIWEIVEFVPLCGILRDQACEKVLFSWHTSVVKLILPQLYPFSFFPLGVNLDSFIAEADCSFLDLLKYDLYIGIGILIGQKWQKWF